MRTYVQTSVDDFYLNIMDEYESAERSKATSATASAASHPTAHIALTVQSSTIMSKTTDWELQDELKPPEQE